MHLFRVDNGKARDVDSAADLRHMCGDMHNWLTQNDIEPTLLEGVMNLK